MDNITYRTNFLTTNNVDGIDEKDLGSIDFGDYDFGADAYYICKQQDIGRPDIISMRIYGTTNYWWFLMRYNGISDVWNDIREGLVIKFPSYEMVREAFKTYRKS